MVIYRLQFWRNCPVRQKTLDQYTVTAVVLQCLNSVLKYLEPQICSGQQQRQGLTTS